jgi:hypothetical protein
VITDIRAGDWRRPAALIFAVCAVAMALILAWVGSWLTIWFDEWDFIFGRQTLTPDSFLVPHVDAFVAVPAAVYFVVLHTFGLASYYPLLIADWLAHFACVGLLGLVVSRKSGVLVGLMAALSLLFLGSAFEALLQPFQMQYLFSVAGGLLALLALDREDRATRHYLVAAAALLFAIASSNVGPIVSGMVGLWALLRRDPPAVSIAALALAAYGVWYLGWQAHLSRDSFSAENLPNVPIQLLYGLGAAVSGVIGLPPARFAWLGLVVGVALVATGLWRGLRPTPLAIAALAALIVEYGLQAVFRGSFGLEHGARSAYLYPAAIFIWLAVAATLGRRLDPRNWTAGRRRFVPLTVGLLIVPMVLGNMAQLYLAARAMQPLRASELRELALIAGLRDVPGLNLDIASDPDLLPQVTARQYFIAIDRFGTPRLAINDPADDLPGPDATRLNALAVRLLGDAITIGPDGVPAPSAPVLNVTSGTAGPDRAGCASLTSSNGTATATLAVGSAGISISTLPIAGPEKVYSQLSLGLFQPADAPLDAALLAQVGRAETIWLPALPDPYSWQLSVRVYGNAVALICARQ